MSVTAGGQNMVKIRFEGKNLANCDFWTKSDPYLILSRPKRGGYDFTKVRKTETIRNNLNPSWKLLYIPLSELCDDDLSMPLKMTVFDEDRNSHDDLIGVAEVTLQQLMNFSVSGTPVILKIGEKKRGEVYVRECDIEDLTTHNLVRKMSASSYPERKPSQVSIPPQEAIIPEHQPPQTTFHNIQPHFSAPQYHHQQHQYHPQQPQYHPQQPQPMYNGYLPQEHQPPYFQQPQFPEDPTDSRPPSIWLQHS